MIDSIRCVLTSPALPVALLCLLTTSVTATPAAVSHTLDFGAATHHYVLVKSVFPTDSKDTLDLAMAVWTPGSYLIREYAKNIEALQATADGTPLRVEKTTKNRWRVRVNGHSAVTVTYRLYCRVLTVQGNWVERDFAMLNGAPTFLTLADDLASSAAQRERPHHVRLELPPEWQRSVTGLSRRSRARRGQAEHDYTARNFDVLIDSPILAGNPKVYEFEAGGKKHTLVNQGEGGLWDGQQSAADVQRIVEVQQAFWGHVPYDNYYFLNVLEEGRGGLEHLNSTLLLTSRWNARVPQKYREWLGLVSHEFFHTWNVKRLRPAGLGPFNYEKEVFTRSLWIAEGITSYYDDLLLRRAELVDRKQYFEALSKQIEKLQTTPGRLVHSLEMSSYDSWIKFYRRDENSVNTTISYYTKGAVVAFLLDARIREATNGARSLDDVMREAYKRFSGERGFEPEEFRALTGETAGTDLSAWFAHALESTEELDYAPAMSWYGLRFKPTGNEDDGEEAEGKDKDKDDEQKKPYLGVTTRTESGRLVITQVRRSTPAYAAGLNVDDEIIAVDDYRVRPGKWSDHLKQYQPGDTVELLVARRDLLRRLPLIFGELPAKKWTLEIDPDASDEQTSRRRAWLGETDAEEADAPPGSTTPSHSQSE